MIAEDARAPTEYELWSVWNITHIAAHRWVVCKPGKIAATNQVHFQNQDDLSAWFQDTFVFGLEDAEGQKIINFSCVSKQGIEIFLKSFVSEEGDKRVNGLTRMWKIYGAHTTQRWAAMCVMFHSLQIAYSVGALASTPNMRIGRTSFDISSRLFPQGKKKCGLGWQWRRVRRSKQNTFFAFRHFL